MLNQLLKNYRTKNFLALLILLLGFASSVVNSYINYQTNKAILYQNIDTRLKTVALDAETVLGKDFFLRATKEGAISSEEDMQNILRLSKIAKIFDVTYIYTMVQKDKKIYFTSSSATDEELKNKDMTVYFDPYDEATPVLLHLLQNNKIAYEESTDKWGTFRSVLIPVKTKGIPPYIIGVDIKIDPIHQKLNEFIKKIIITQSIVFLLFIIIAFYFVKISKKELYEIGVINRNLDQEIENKTKELEEFNRVLEERIKDEVAKNREKDKQLIDHSRLIQMGEAISMIAHQWRQPLNSISAAVGLLDIRIKTKKLDEESLKKVIDNIKKYVNHLSVTIDDFRDFFKPQKDLQLSNFNTITERVMSLIQYTLKNKEITIDVEKLDVVDFLTYENELVQVIINILKNADDALSEKNIKNPKISLTIDSRTLIIEDNAGGIDKEIVEKIFDPYFSTKGKNGTGLGLYMSKLIVQEHCNGKLEVSNTDNGARFIITIDKDNQ
jgi:signal transduction histidine kinase